MTVDCPRCGGQTTPCFGSPGGDPGRGVRLRVWWCLVCGHLEKAMLRERYLRPEHFGLTGDGLADGLDAPEVQ
jgi:hypothetical protein